MAVAVVTGAGRGIGAATARLAAARGYAVCVNYVEREAPARTLVEEIRAGGGRAMLARADTSEEAAVVGLFEAVDRELGPVTALVNNAGITGPATRIEGYDAATIRRVLEVNVVGPMLCAREAARRMSTRLGGPGGAIVNVSSMAAKLGGGGTWTAYGASKGAIDTLTVGLAGELAGEGIRVNAIAPGLIDTEIHAAAGLGDRLATMAPTVPLKRSGTARECAEAILFLLSDAAAYITGAVLPVSGGR